MCAPIAIAALAGMQMASTYQQLEHQKSMARYNQSVGETQARQIEEAGAEEAAAVRRNASLMLSKQRAGFSASGIDIGAGSALDELTKTDYFGQVDVETSKTNTRRKAWAARAQAQAYGMEASSINPATSSLLAGARTVASSWYSGGSPGFSGTQAPAPVEIR